MFIFIDRNYLESDFAFDIDKMPKKYSDSEIKFFCDEAGYRVNFLTEGALDDDVYYKITQQQETLVRRAMATMALH